jgi:hypothetical protein
MTSHLAFPDNQVRNKMKALPPELNGKMRQYKRILISYADFKHAKLASSYIIREKLHEKYPEESYVLLEALNCSMIMAYCRPFSGNSKVAPDLPRRLLKVLNDKEIEIHNTVLNDRNKVLAHSDADQLNIDPVKWKVGGKELVVPIFNWGLAPLIEEATLTFNTAATKLYEATMKERMRIEPELVDYLREADPEDPFR